MKKIILFAITVILSQSNLFAISSKYEEGKTYEEIAKAPEKISKKSVSYHQFQLNFNECDLEVDAKYGLRYYKEFKTSSKGNLLIVYSSKDKKIGDVLKTLLPDSKVIVGGELKKGRTKKTKKNRKSEYFYSFIIKEIEVFTQVETKVNDKGEVVFNFEFNQKEYEPVSATRLAIQINQFIDKKIFFESTGEDFSIEQIKKEYISLANMSQDNYFSVRISGFPFDVIAHRSNKYVIENLIAATKEKAVVFYGTFLKIKDETKKRSRAIYYLQLDATELFDSIGE